MSTQHTPGPWQASGVRIKIDRQPFLQVCGGPKDYVVAYVPYSDRTPVEHIESHADQRLIAAAPALYDAIRNSDDAHWTPAMRAAMAKVEGR